MDGSRHCLSSNTTSCSVSHLQVLGNLTNVQTELVTHSTPVGRTGHQSLGPCPHCDIYYPAPGQSPASRSCSSKPPLEGVKTILYSSHQGGPQPNSQLPKRRASVVLITSPYATVLLYLLISGYTWSRYHWKFLHFKLFLKALLSDTSPMSIPAF